MAITISAALRLRHGGAIRPRDTAKLAGQAQGLPCAGSGVPA